MSIDKLANTLHILFLGYGLNNNKTLKIQLKVFLDNEFNIENYDLLDSLIIDLINEYDFFDEFKKDWFLNQSKNIIKIFGGK